MSLSTGAALLKTYLEKYCLGRAAARAQHLIRGHLAAAGCRIGAREFFDLEAELVAAGVPLGTNGAGVFLCVDGEDFDVAYNYIVSRFEPMRERAEALKAMQGGRVRPLPPENEYLVDARGQARLFDAVGLVG